MVVGGFPPDLHEVFTSCDAVLLLLIRQTVWDSWCRCSFFRNTREESDECVGEYAVDTL
jgi:hypothetical protein